jgi:hypothetical protein
VSQFTFTRHGACYPLNAGNFRGPVIGAAGTRHFEPDGVFFLQPRLPCPALPTGDGESPAVAISAGASLIALLQYRANHGSERVTGDLRGFAEGTHSSDYDAVRIQLFDVYMTPGDHAPIKPIANYWAFVVSSARNGETF